MAHIERMAFLNPSMSIPQWARPILDILHHYNYRLSYLLMSGLADIKQVIHILDRHHLFFWSQVFSEYSLVCSLIDSDGLKDFHKNINQRSYDQKISSQKWVNHRIFGSNHINMLKVRNRKHSVSVTFEDSLNVPPNEPSAHNSNMWLFFILVFSN